MVTRKEGKPASGRKTSPKNTGKSKRSTVAVIQENEQKLLALNAISDLITQSLENRDILDLATEKIMAIMNADAVMVFLLVPDAQYLTLELYKGVSDDFVDGVKRIKIGEGFNGRVAETGESLVIEDATTNPLLNRQAVITEGIRSQLIVPLRSKGEVIGTLCVARHIATEFKDEEVSLLSSIGNQIGSTLENARLYQEMKQTLKQLQQSEERYRDLFETASDAIWVHDFEGNMLASNEACTKVTGYSSEELQDLHVDLLMNLFSKSCIDRTEDKLLRGEPVETRCEVELTQKAGERAIVEVTTSLVSSEGEPIGFQHAARDITEERRMQENLRYYLQQVTRAQEEERKRIARELHDETLQNLIVISRQLEKITSSEALWEESLGVVRGLKKQIEVAVQEMRRFSHDLRPSVLDDLGLLPALELLADDLEKLEILTKFEAKGTIRRLTPETEVMLFRIAQEATRNIWRHAEATAAEMTLEFTDTRLKMVIKDNGKGFRIPRWPGEQASTGKLGMTGMKERAMLLGGTLTVESRPNKGTVINVEVRA